MRIEKSQNYNQMKKMSSNSGAAFNQLFNSVYRQEENPRENIVLVKSVIILCLRKVLYILYIYTVLNICLLYQFNLMMPPIIK
jgi:hypothetical protein